MMNLILHEIFEEGNICEWKEYKENIISNFNNINYMESIPNYIPCQRKLYLTRPKIRIKKRKNQIQIHIYFCGRMCKDFSEKTTR